MCGRVEPDEEYQATLLLNCLLGLLIYPHHLAHENNWGEWLTNDLVKDVGEEWGITLEHVQCAGHKSPNKRFKQGRCESCGHQKSEFVAIDKPKLTIRQLVRQMRNAVAHPSFSVSTGQDGSDQITSIAFQDRDRGTKRVNCFMLTCR
ncbi:MAG: HEPN family nuclease [Caldilineaceae bacterium]